MNLSDDARGALGCPRCSGDALTLVEGTLLCIRCARRYPFIGKVPCLMPDPSLWRHLWSSRLGDYVSATQTRVRQLHSEAALPDLLPRTRRRVLHVLGGLEEQQAQIERLFEPLQGVTGQVPPSAIPSRPEPGDRLAVLECYENVFRDWVWGDKEIEITRRMVERMILEPIGRLAVYGAGAGRLAVDVHQSLRPTLTFALDANPLPFLIAETLVSGHSLDLPEFPVDPNSDEQAVISRHLACSYPVREGFGFVFADALCPPFSPGSLDAVLTSWFVDATRADFREIAAVINRVLRPGGHWINLGPLRFKTILSRFYSIQEVHEIVSASAFDLLSRVQEDVPYFDSPVSGSRRTETVFGFGARKTGEVGPAQIPDLTPPWVANARLPVPLLPALTALGKTSMFTAGAIAMIDGSRSIAQIAGALAGSWGIDRSLIEDQLRAFFAKLPHD